MTDADTGSPPLHDSATAAAATEQLSSSPETVPLSPEALGAWSCRAWSCACSCHCSPSSTSWRRSVKRKLDQLEAGSATQPQLLTGPGDGDMPSVDVLARVEVENECSALREALASQQQTIQELYLELEEERNASSTAANEAMSMILRLQREKAEALMEARQFRRFAEEKMAHDQQELLALEDVFFKRDQAVKSLTYEVQAYRHRLMSYGIHPEADPADFATPRGKGVGGEPSDDWANNNNNTGINNSNGDVPDDTATGTNGNSDEADGCETPVYEYMPVGDYPPLKCIAPDVDLNDDLADLEKHASGDTPRTPASATREHLHHIEQRIFQLERTPSNVTEKGVVRGNSSPRRSNKHFRGVSSDSGSSLFSREEYNYANGKRHEEFPTALDRLSDVCEDDAVSDRVYTIDAVHGVPQHPAAGLYDDYVSTPRDSTFRSDAVVEEAEIKKLYTRLQALEADRESLKQAIIAMRTDSAQLVLLKEIAQNLCKGMTQPEPFPDKRIVKKTSTPNSFKAASVFKWVVSFMFWKRNAAARSKFNFDRTNDNVGLLYLIDRSPHLRQWRCVTRGRA